MAFGMEVCRGPQICIQSGRTKAKGKDRMRHLLVVYDRTTELELTSVRLTADQFAAIKDVIPPDDDDPDMIGCYALPLDFFLEPDGTQS